MRRTMMTGAAWALGLSLASAANAAPGPDEKPVACKKVPPGQRSVKMNLKPDTELGDLIAWISTITCKEFLLPGAIPADKKMTVVAPDLITPEEAYRLFLGALDSAGLTIEHAGKFERIVEIATIKTIGGVPVYADGVDVPTTGSYVTRMIPRESLSPAERARMGAFDIHNGSFPSLDKFIIVTEVVRVIGEKSARACKPAPPGKPSVKLNLAPATKVDDLVAWIASLSCKRFMLPDSIPPDSKRVTVVAPQLITPEEAYALFLAALDSVSLTVEGSGDFLRIADVADREPLVTRLVRVEHMDPKEIVQVLGRIKGERGKIVVLDSGAGIVITDLAENVNRMVKVLAQL